MTIENKFKYLTTCTQLLRSGKSSLNLLMGRDGNLRSYHFTVPRIFKYAKDKEELDGAACSSLPIWGRSAYKAMKPVEGETYLTVSWGKPIGAKKVNLPMMQWKLCVPSKELKIFCEDSGYVASLERRAW